MKIYKNTLELIGNTPIVELSKFKKENNLNTTILAKLEAFNPNGSVKDRVAKMMIETAKSQGLLKEGSTIIEPTSGNTGIGLAAVASYMGYKVILTMPETMSLERRKLLKAYGAELVLTDGSKGMKGAIEKAQELHKEIKNSFIPSQFENPINPKTHFLSTGPEIWEDTDGNIDIFVATVGTGGTLSGTAEFLKSKNPKIKVVAVEPLDSPVLSKGTSGVHKIQGIGAGFIPKTLNTDIYDEVIAVSNEDAYRAGQELAKFEAILSGISSGAALAAVKEISKKEENKNKTIVTILPDTGERYLSTPSYFNE